MAINHSVARLSGVGNELVPIAATHNKRSSQGLCQQSKRAEKGAPICLAIVGQ